MFRARFRRWCHQMWRLNRPWRWRDEPPCCAYTESLGFLVLGRLYVPTRTTLVACGCNWVFGRAAQPEQEYSTNPGAGEQAA